jgi:hypothetical protein
MKEHVNATRYFCGGCGKMTLVDEEIDGKPPGYHGTVHEVQTLGQSGEQDWYAHAAKCIRPAILSAVEYGWRNP